MRHQQWLVTELTTTQKVSDATYARAKKVFSDQQIVDLTAVAGNYVMVALILAAILIYTLHPWSP